MDRQTDRFMDERTNIQIYGLTDNQTNSWMDRQTDRFVDGQTNRLIN